MIQLTAHHDGSERYVSHVAPQLGETVTLWLRVPRHQAADHVWVRTAPDAEPRWDAAVVDRATAHETWWRAEVPMTNPVMRYRFLLHGGAAGYCWVNAAGVFHRDVTDANDFWLTSAAPPPAWLDTAVVYQIFPDRFASSGAPRHWPSWAVPSGWQDPIDPDWRVSTRQMFGGDLPGIQAHLDHIVHLGATVLYLTPFFPAESAHRYNAQAFDRVDDLLGGDQALIDLVAGAHRAGLRVVGDLTTNHTGDTHDWFHAAQRDRASTEASFYFFDGDGPEDYVGWFGVKTLPKLDHRAPALAGRMLAGADSITGRWLRPPYDLDGWRIDVANMTGRHADVDTNHAVATTMRATMAEVRPDAWLVAEHCYDASEDLRGDGWHGTMNYAGFTRPVWSWLGDQDHRLQVMGYPAARPSLGGNAVRDTMVEFVAAMPWRSTRASLTLLGSHDTARWRSAAGSRARQIAGFGMLATYPGVPMVYYGDEVGLRGEHSDTGRAPMPWSAEAWDGVTLDAYRSLIGVRLHSTALQRGGMRWLYAADDVLVYARESVDDTVVVQVSRGPHPTVELDLAAAGITGELAVVFGRLEHGPHQAPGAQRVPISADEACVNIWRSTHG